MNYKWLEATQSCHFNATGNSKGFKGESINLYLSGYHKTQPCGELREKFDSDNAFGGDSFFNKNNEGASLAFPILRILSFKRSQAMLKNQIFVKRHNVDWFLVIDCETCNHMSSDAS